jgi:hypothetical protein
MTICLICGMGLYALVSVNAIAGIIMICIKLGFIKKYTIVTQKWSIIFCVEYLINGVQVFLQFSLNVKNVAK